MIVKKVWLVLPGGGVRGAFQAGFISEFVKIYPYIVIDRVYGTSVGAIMAPVIMDNRYDDLVEMYSSFKAPTDVFTPWSLIEAKLPQASLMLRGSAYKSVGIIDKVTAGTPAAVYDKCYCAAWDLTKKKTKWFTGTNYIEGMRASSALPMAVPPYKMGESQMIDGYIDALIPLDLIKQHLSVRYDDSPVIVLIVDCSTRRFKIMDEPPKNVFSLMAEVASDATLANCLNKLDRDFTEMGVPVLHIKPANVAFNSAMDFDETKISASIVDGVNMARSLLLRQYL